MPYLHQQHIQQLRERNTGQQLSPEDARMQCQQNIVKHQVAAMYRNSPSRSTEDDSFYQYQLCCETVIFSGTYSNIYLATHQDTPEYPLVGRVYEPQSKIDPHRSSYMRVLNQIGKRSPGCIATWDIYYDENGRVVIFQEFAMHGNLREYLSANNVYVHEEQLHEWAVQIYRGMDYLGDNGICHRAIWPKHILLTPSPEEQGKTLAKLGSFRDSIIYYDLLQDRVRQLPPKQRNGRTQANFQAPEVFVEKTNDPKAADPKVADAKQTGPATAGSMESTATKERGGSVMSNVSGASQVREPSDKQFDPILADIYSYGATFFYANTRTFPIRHKTQQPGVDPSPLIQKTINHARNLSPEAKAWFSGILAGDPAQRTPFEKIAADPWFKNGPQKAGEQTGSGGGQGQGAGGAQRPGPKSQPGGGQGANGPQEQGPKSQPKQR